MSERRQTERAPCRLRCRIARGREQIPSRIVDVSEGGLCLVLPVWLKPKQNYEISIDVPGTGLSRVHAEIWHIRREESQTSSGRVWVAGAILVDSDEAFAKLLTATGVLSNDTDPEGDSLDTTLLTDVAFGSLTLNPDGSFVYAHDGSESSVDLFTYEANDGNGGVGTATVTLSVAGPLGRLPRYGY